MDPRLLRHYNLELQHLREMGAEFAQQFPKIAGRLNMSGLEVADPYVERLLEGFAFLAGRIQLKLDAEFPRFTQALLEIIYPHYLAPTPSMLVAQFNPDLSDPGLAVGRVVPRRTSMSGTLPPGDVTACEFRTAHDLTLWPLTITSANYFTFAPDLPLNTLPIGPRVKGGLRIRLKTTADLKWSQLSLDRLPLFLTGRDDVANGLYELCLGPAIGVLVRSPSAKPDQMRLLPPSTIKPVGFADDQALLPVTLRSFRGYRLLQEYFSFPQRYRFVDVTGLGPAVRANDGTELEIVILFGRGDPTLESVVDAKNLALFCTPAVNMFEKSRMDRIAVTDSTHEFHVVADRTRPLDFEVYQVTAVTGHGAGDDGDRQFLPFYSASSVESEDEKPAYFTVRREPRLIPPEQRRRGFRSSYIGTEVFLSLVDARQTPFSADLRQLSLEALCTNRDLVLLMPTGLGRTDFSLNVAAPVESIRVVAGPSRPYSSVGDGSTAWRAIDHLSLNYLSLVDASPAEGASALRDLLGLYAISGDSAAKRQVEGIRSVTTERVVRRIPDRGPLAFGRGLAVNVEVDELAFEGGSAFMLGAVLNEYFARHVSINSMTETALRSQSRGEINRWTPNWGARPTL